MSPAWRTGGWVALAAVAYLAPALGAARIGMTGPQGVALGIVLAALLLWVSEAVPLFVTGAAVALVAAVALAPAVGATPDTFVAPFASDVSLLFLGGFVLSEVMRAHGLDARVARAVLARVGAAPDRVVGGVLAATAALSMWMSNSAAAAMMLALVGALRAPLAASDPLRTALVLAVAAGANVGGMGTPIGTPPNAIAIASLQRAGLPAPSFVEWVLLASPVAAVALAGAWRFLLHQYPPAAERVELPPAPGPLTAEGAVAAALVVATALLWLTAGLHPLSPGAVGWVPLIVAFGARLLPADALRQLPWDVLGVVGGGLTLGVVVDVSGLDAWFVARLPLGGLGQLGLVVAFVVVAAALSCVMSNTAAANLILPLALAVPGAGPVLGLAVALACSGAMALPISTPPNTLAFGAAGIDGRSFARAGVALTGIAVGSVLVVGLPLWGAWAWLRG